MKFEQPKYTQGIGQQLAAKDAAFAERLAGVKRALPRLAGFLAIGLFLIYVIG